MLRWLLLGGLLFGLVSGVRNGWVELRWDRLLNDAGVPFVPDPDRPSAPAERSQAGAGVVAWAEAVSRSSAREARNPSR